MATANDKNSLDVRWQAQRRAAHKDFQEGMQESKIVPATSFLKSKSAVRGGGGGTVARHSGGLMRGASKPTQTRGYIEPGPLGLLINVIR